MLLQIANRYEELENAAKIANTLTINDLRVSRSKHVIESTAQANGMDVEYAFAAYGPNGFRQILPYSRKNNATFNLSENGKFRIWVHVREISNPEKVLVRKSSEIKIAGK